MESPLYLMRPIVPVPAVIADREIRVFLQPYVILTDRD